jgi:hypothetical protein
MDQGNSSIPSESSTTATALNYNSIFGTLVTSKTPRSFDDVCGRIAYSFYKEDKRGWIQAHESYSNQELQAFIDGCKYDSRLNDYKKRAESLLLQYLADYQQLKTKKELDDIKNELKNEIEECKPKPWHNFWKSFGTSILSSVAFASVLFLITFLYAGVNPETNASKILRCLIAPNCPLQTK